MSFRILGEKTRPSKRLCDSCSYSQIVKGPQQGNEVVICKVGGYEPIRFSFPVVECSEYELKGALTEYTAEKIGWVLEVRGGKVMGFNPPIKNKE